MKKYEIILPNKLKAGQSLKFIEELQHIPFAEEYVFYFDSINWSEPDYCLFLAK